MTYAIAQDLLSFHSIGFLCERGPEIAYVLVWDGRFPFNWFPLRERTILKGIPLGMFLWVSIQLVSSAREDM